MNRLLALTLSASLSLLSAADAAADNINVPSRVQAATIFPSAVSIRRAAHQHFLQGEHALRFGPLPTGVIDESIRLNGVGPGLITEGFTIRTGTLGELTPNAVAALTELLAGLHSQRTHALAERESLVRGLDPRQLQGIRGLADVDQRLRSLAVAISTRSAELELLRAHMNTPVKYVIVDVTTARDGDADLTLDYLMPNAGTWAPSYMAYLSGDGGTIALDVMAAVQQRTGEDWTGVRLTVSSVNPAGAVALPTLEERSITLGPEPEPEAREVAAMQARPASAREPSMARSAARSTDDMIATLPVAVPTPIEHRAAVVRANLLSARLEIATLVSLRSGALPRRVLAAHSELPCVMEHQAAPRQVSSVFLTAKMRNHNAFPLLSGPVALFVEREYVGVTTMPDVPVDEEVFVPFGIDPSVTVDRTLATHAATRQGTRDQSSVRYDYRVSNHRDRPVDLVVFEQIPVSRSAGLLVRTSSDTRVPSARREHDAPGTLRWNLHLLSGASDRWHLGMIVDSPHGREIEGDTN